MKNPAPTRSPMLKDLGSSLNSLSRTPLREGKVKNEMEEVEMCLLSQFPGKKEQRETASLLAGGVCRECVHWMPPGGSNLSPCERPRAALHLPCESWVLKVRAASCRARLCPSISPPRDTDKEIVAGGVPRQIGRAHV